MADPLPLTGTSSLPIPVTISDQESLAPFLAHLEGGGTHNIDILTGKAPHQLQASKGQEPYYGTNTAEFDKGILYDDGRMDLCKM